MKKNNQRHSLNAVGLAIAVLTAGLTLSSCLQVGNSFSNDKAAFSRRIGNERFNAFKDVMRESCQRCHPNFLQWSEGEFLSNRSSLGTPMVTAKDLLHSEIYQRLQGAGPRGDMPQGGSLSSSDVQTVADWILELDTAPVNVVPTRPPMNTPAQRFSAARGILTRSGSCVTCHGTGEDYPFVTYTEAQFKTNMTSDGDFYVVPGDPAASGLIRRTRGADPFGDMPPAPRVELSTDDIDILRQWIQEMSVVVGVPNPPSPVVPAPAPPVVPNPAPPPPLSPEPVVTAEQRYLLAKSAIQSKCISCHSEFGEWSESEFVENSYIQPGAPANSELFKAIRGAGPDGFMPPSRRPQMTAEEIESIRSWIEQMPVNNGPRRLRPLQLKTQTQKFF